MEMTDEEIVRSYRQAQCPSKQVGVLADLNMCTKTVMTTKLEELGCIEPGKKAPLRHKTGGRKKKDPKPKEAAPMSAEKIGLTAGAIVAGLTTMSGFTEMFPDAAVICDGKPVKSISAQLSFNGPLGTIDGAVVILSTEDKA